jgi:hypothetical protein
MADPLKPLRPGDPFPTSAKTWNPLLELARKSETSPLPSSPPIANANSQTIVMVKNRGQATLDRYAPIMLSGTSRIDGTVQSWEILPSVNPDVIARPVIRGRDNLGIQRKHGVTLQPIEVDKFGPVVISGAVPCKVWTETDSYPTHAEPAIDGTTFRQKMVGAFCGYPILAREQGTGDKWALVLMGHRTMARAHFWYPFGVSGGNPFPFYSAYFTGQSHNLPAQTFSAGFAGQTNAPHIFEKRADGIYFKNRDIRWFRSWARWRFAGGSSSKSISNNEKIAVTATLGFRVWQVIQQNGITYHTSDAGPGGTQFAFGPVVVNYGGAQIATGGVTTGASFFQGEGSHYLVFAAYVPTANPTYPTRLTLNGVFKSDEYNDKYLTAQIRDCEIWIEEIEQAEADRILTTTVVGPSTLISGSSNQQTENPDSLGSGSGSVEPAEGPA